MKYADKNHVTLQHSIKVGTVTGGILGVIIVLILTLSAYFFLEYNAKTITWGIIKIVNFFHPLNPLLFLSSCITILATTAIGLLISIVLFFCLARKS